MNNFRGSITVTNREPIRCDVCRSAEVIYVIGFKDRNDVKTISYKGEHTIIYNFMAYSCKDHIAEATHIMYKKAGLCE